MAKVLLVEDDNNLREIYQARLMAEGYDIVAAQNGEEALVVAKQNKPDLIISDVMMPRISGFEMLDILRNTEGLKHTPVIMLTALGQTEDQKRADSLGANKYLVKSQVTLEDIVDAAKGLLETNGATPTEIADVPPAPDPVPAAVAEPATPAPVVVSTPAPAPEPAAPAPTPAPTPVEPPVVTPAPAPAPAPAAEPVATPDPTPAPEPVAEPAPTAPSEAGETTDGEAKAEAAVSDAATQTLEAEEKALQEQIANYAKEPAVDPPVVEPTAETTTTEAKADSENQETLAEAVEELNEATPEPEPIQPPSVANAPEPEPAAAPTAEVSAPAPAPEPPAPAPEPKVVEAPAETTSDNVSVAGKKVIKPLNDPTTKPKLDELLAKEEATVAAQAPAVPATPIVDGAVVRPPTNPPAATPGQTFDPNTVAL